MPTAFGVKWCHVKNDPRFFSVIKRFDELPVLPDRHHLSFRGRKILPQSTDIQIPQIRYSDPLVCLTCRPGSIALYLHGCLKPRLIQCQTIFVQDLFRQLPGESEGIVELKGIAAGQLFLPRGLKCCDVFIEHVAALGQCSVKAFLLQGNDLFDIILLFHQRRKIRCVTIDVHHRIHRAGEEILPKSQKPSMTHCPTQNTAQDIAASLIRRQDAVHDHDSHAPGVISNNFQGNILLRIIAIAYPRKLRRVRDDGKQEIRFKVCFLPLHYRSQSFQAAARINILVR